MSEQGSEPQVTEPSATQGGAVTTPPPEPQAEPGKPLGDAAPVLTDLLYQSCPNCGIGVLQVTWYDPNATHEAGQRFDEPHQLRSGGSYHVLCPNCNFSESRPLNPEQTR